MFYNEEEGSYISIRHHPLTIRMILFLFFIKQTKGYEVQHKKSKKLYRIPLEFKNGVERTVKVKAASRETAEARALKFHPNAIRVKKNA